MFRLITLSAILGITCASPGFLDGGIGGAAKKVVRGAVIVAKIATLFGVGGPNVEAAVKGAELLFGSDETFGSNKKTKAEYSGVLQYYRNLGIEFYPESGFCSCPLSEVVEPGFPHYSPNSPFSINGVYQIDDTESCTCPPELIATVVEASHKDPGFFQKIVNYVG